MARASVVLGALMVGGAAAKLVPLATFDKARETTWPWEAVNDPVMGGASHSTFKVDSAQQLGVWSGEVKIVPFLGAPGFCNLQAPGLHKTADFPDVSGTDGIAVRARQTDAQGLTRFNVMLMTKGARHGLQEGVYGAEFVMSGELKETFVPWSAFRCTWRGSNVTWCPALETQLAEIDGIGIGTFFPGEAGPFRVEFEAMFAASAPTAVRVQTAIGATDLINLATFDGTTSHTWKTENDPVMGGQSESTFEVKDGYGDYSGTCRIVPSLKAPGFTFALTENQLVARFPDVSSADGIILGLRNLDANITKFRFAFCDSRINPFRCQFQTFKASFTIEPSKTFTEVFLPWSAFSDKWSSYTGEHTSEEPPQAASLRSITQLQLWTEGVAGHFHIQLKYVKAGKVPSQKVHSLLI